MAPRLVLRNAVVKCEGFESVNDPYVIIESCGLEYELEYQDGRKTPMGNPDGSSLHSPIIKEDWIVPTLSIFLAIVTVIFSFGFWVQQNRRVAAVDHHGADGGEESGVENGNDKKGAVANEVLSAPDTPKPDTDIFGDVK
jgi:hypothetical protein